MLAPLKTISGALPGDVSASEAVDAVVSLREALQRADVQAVQSVRWLAPRPPGERDLLSDLAAAEGLERAIRRLARFWRRADVVLEHVRIVSVREAEVYERLRLPGESLPIVTLVRRATADSPWRVVCTNEAHDERFTIWLASTRETLDDVAWSRAFAQRFGEGGELIMDGGTGVLGDPESGWLAHVRGPFAPRTWPVALPGEGTYVVELATALEQAPEARMRQLEWLLRASSVFLGEQEGAAAYLPAHEKVVVRQAIEMAVTQTLRPDQVVALWARTQELDGHVVTSGLRLLGLPEVEAPRDLFDNTASTTQLVRWLAAQLVETPHELPALGTELVTSTRTFTVEPGRRGPRRGKSYGRYGALRIEPSHERGGKRGSWTRLRVPEHLR